MTDTVRPEFIDFAHRLADAAGDVIRPYFRAAVAVDEKADSSPVTVADREAEQRIRDVLTAERPQDGIFGEEFGVERLQQLFSGQPPGSAREAIETILRAVSDFAGDIPQSDDVTCLVLRRGPR